MTNQKGVFVRTIADYITASAKGKPEPLVFDSLSMAGLRRTLAPLSSSANATMQQKHRLPAEATATRSFTA